MSGATSRYGGWKKVQLIALGLNGFGKKWKRKIIGKEISEDNAKKFLELKNYKKDLEIIEKYNRPYFNIKSNEKKIIDFTEELKKIKALPYKEYLQTDHWQSTRNKALKTAGHNCQICSSSLKLHVHHRTYNNIGR